MGLGASFSAAPAGALSHASVLMNTLVHNPAPDFGEAQAHELARRLHRATASWAAAFLRSRKGFDLALADQLTSETLAYALVLLEARLGAFGPLTAGFADQVRREAWMRHARWGRRHSLRQRLGFANPAAATSGDGDSAFAIAFASGYGAAEEDFQFTEPMLAEFQALTGLGSGDLVGEGPNLAALLFYLVVHGRVFARQADTLEQRRWLIQALRECREYLERAIDHWLRAPEARAKPVSASIGR